MRKKMDAVVFFTLCIAPAFLLYALLYIYPSLRVFGTSLFEWSGLDSPMIFVGFQNFADLFQDRNFLKSFGNTLILMLIVPIPTLAIALLSASALARKELRERDFYRVVFFFPSVLSFVVVAIIWSFVFHPTMGLINTIFNGVGLEALALPWLGSEDTVLGAIAVVMVWQAFGYYMVMYIAGIDAIPKELYEAAEVDGAGKFLQFRKITLPMLWQVIRVTLIFMINGSVVISFTVVNILTNGGPNWASEVVLNQIYKQAMTNANFGYAMAASVVVFVFCIVLSLISNRITKRDEVYR